jgi:hypothetical protein
MTRIRITDDNLLPAMFRFSWLLLLVLTAAGLLLGSVRMGLSILVGGMVAIANNYWLRNILQRILIQQRSDASTYAIFRFVLRYLLLALVVLSALKAGADIAGLLLGLSVLVITTILFTFYTLMQPKGD